VYTVVFFDGVVADVQEEFMMDGECDYF